MRYLHCVYDVLPLVSLILIPLAFVLGIFLGVYYFLRMMVRIDHMLQAPSYSAELQAKCHTLYTEPGPSSNFYDRVVSDRFVEGTNRVWIRNATIWTGGVQGHEVIQGDLFLTNGIIKAVGHVDMRPMNLGDRDEIDILDAHGAYVTPG